MASFEVTVPPNAPPMSVISVTTPDGSTCCPRACSHAASGQPLQVQVPVNALAGTVIAVRHCAAAGTDQHRSMLAGALPAAGCSL